MSLSGVQLPRLLHTSATQTDLLDEFLDGNSFNNAGLELKNLVLVASGVSYGVLHVSFRGDGVCLIPYVREKLGQLPLFRLRRSFLLYTMVHARVWIYTWSARKSEWWVLWPARMPTIRTRSVSGIRSSKGDRSARLLITKHRIHV